MVLSNRVVVVEREKNRLRYILEVKSGRLNNGLEGNKGKRGNQGWFSGFWVEHWVDSGTIYEMKNTREGQIWGEMM